MITSREYGTGWAVTFYGPKDQGTELRIDYFLAFPEENERYDILFNNIPEEEHFIKSRAPLHMIPQFLNELGYSIEELLFNGQLHVRELGILLMKEIDEQERNKSINTARNCRKKCR